MAVAVAGDTNAMEREGETMRDRRLMETINVLSLNCWGLKYLSKYRVERLAAIADQIAASSYDIVALQEIWVQNDYKQMRIKVKNLLPYSKFYYSAMMGAGLAVFSKWPITETTMFSYPLNGRPTAFWRGDWYVGKGVACATIAHPSGTYIDVLNTHFHAPYGKGEDTYRCHRNAQAWEMAKLIRGSVRRRHLTLAVGDFNSHPLSATHKLVTMHGLVGDAWLDDAAHAAIKIPSVETLSDLQRIQLLGVTCDSRLNSWRAYVTAKDMDDPSAKRFDYIFYNKQAAKVLGSKVVFTERVPHASYTFSDHFGIEVQFELHPDKNTTPYNHNPSDLLDVFHDIQQNTTTYISREQRYMNWRTIHLILTPLLLIALFIGVWWVPPGWPAFLITVASTVIGITGVVHGLLIGNVFGRWEMRRLWEFQDEINMAISNIK